jgi:hypothetical protein
MFSSLTLWNNLLLVTLVGSLSGTDKLVFRIEVRCSASNVIQMISDHKYQWAAEFMGIRLENPCMSSGPSLVPVPSDVLRNSFLVQVNLLVH